MVLWKQNMLADVQLAKILSRQQVDTNTNDTSGTQQDPATYKGQLTWQLLRHEWPALVM
jgi:hypothetical protein